MVKVARLVVALVIGVSAAQSVAGAGKMSLEAARLRIAASLEIKPENLKALAEVAERVGDDSVGALAAYNAGTMAVALKDRRAEQLLAQADRRAGDATLRASARYNMGHAALPAEGGPEDSPAAIDAKIEAYRKAARRFRSVLDVDRQHLQAARNTELARRKIRELQERKEQAAKEKKQAEDLAKQLENLAKQQQQQADESQKQADRGRKPEAGDREKQQSVSQQTERAAQAAEQAGAGEGTRESMQRAREAQQKAEESLEKRDLKGAAEQQREAAEALKEAAERARSGKHSPGDVQAGEEQASADPAGGEGAEQAPQAESKGEGDGQRIDPLAESLLDKERRERAQRMQYLQRGGRQQVERDW